MVIVGVDRFPELVYEVGESVGKEPETFCLVMKVGYSL